MGTNYKIWENRFFGELEVDEMSNKLSLLFFNSTVIDGAEDVSLIEITKKMTPEEMAMVFLKGLTVCSYWMDTDKLKTLMQNHIEREIY